MKIGERAKAAAEKRSFDLLLSLRQCQCVSHQRGERCTRFLSSVERAFIGSYVVRELLRNDFEVTVVDNFSKYGYWSTTSTITPASHGIEKVCRSVRMNDMEVHPRAPALTNRERIKYPERN